MSASTLKNLKVTEELHALLKEEARRRGLKLTAYTHQVLCESLGIVRGPFPSPRPILDAEDKKAIRSMRHSHTAEDLADRYSVSESLIRKIWSGER